MAQPHPLALLGDVIAGAGAQYAANAQQRQLMEQARQQRLADIAAERAFQQEQIREAREYQKGQTAEERLYQQDREREERDFQSRWRKQGWEQEEKLYDKRRDEAMKARLVDEGHLDPEERDKPAAFMAALKKGGAQYRRDLEELTRAQASIPTIIASTKGDPKLIDEMNSVLEMKTTDIARVRGVMKKANALVAKTVRDEWDMTQKNKEHAALLTMTHLQKFAELENKRAKVSDEADRITSRRYNPNEEAKVHAYAKTLLTPAERKVVDSGAMTPSVEASYNAAREKAFEKIMLPIWSNLTTEAKSFDTQLGRLDNQFRGVQVAAKEGFAGMMDFKKSKWSFADEQEEGGEAPVATRDDAKNFLTSGGFGKPPPTDSGAGPAPGGLGAAGPAAGPATPVPVAPPAALPQPWTPPEENPAANLIERNPATGGLLRSAADVQRARNSDALSTAVRGFLDPADAPVDMSTGQLASAGQKLLGFGLNRTPTSSLYDRIRALSADPRSPHRIQLAKDAMILARARGETVPEDIAQEFGIQPGAAPPIATPVPIPALDQLPTPRMPRTAVPIPRSTPVPALDTSTAFSVPRFELPAFTAPGPMIGESLQQQEAEDRILTRAPYSLQAIEIRRRRGDPSLSQSAPVVFGL